MKKKISLFVLLSFLVLQVFSPIGGKEVTVSAADGDEGVANLDFTFQTVDGTSVSTRSDSGQATVLIFGMTDCGYTQRTVKSIATSKWVSRSDIRVIFAECQLASAGAVKSFAATYGCDDITFCYDEKPGINSAMFNYFDMFYNNDKTKPFIDTFTAPLTVLIDGDNQIRHCLTDYQSADTIMSKMQEYVAPQPTDAPSQEPAQSEGVANLDYTFQGVDGTSVSTKSDSGQATVIIFGRTNCGNSKSTVRSIAASQWVSRSDIRVIFAECDSASAEAVRSFAVAYGCNDITFCYDEGYNINRAMWTYYHLYSDEISVTLPVTVLIDGKNQIRHCLTGYQTADIIKGKLDEFIAADKSTESSKKPAETSTRSSKKNSIIRDNSGNTYQVTRSGKVNGTVTYVRAKKNQAATVNVPSKVTIGGVTYEVTSISAKAFRGNTKLKKVVIGKNVSSIGNSAFEGCTSLKSIVIPSKVKSIGKNAFKNCKKLKSIKIKGNVLKKVGKNAFKGIHAKAKVKVPKKQLETYKKRLKGKGQKNTVKITR